MARLKDLSLRVNLNTEEQREETGLLEDLSVRYGDLGIEVGRTAGKITRLNSVTASLQEISVKVTGAEDAGTIRNSETGFVRDQRSKQNFTHLDWVAVQVAWIYVTITAFSRYQSLTNKNINDKFQSTGRTLSSFFSDE